MPAWRRRSPKSAAGIIIGNENQQLSNLLRQFSNAIAAFCQDMGDRMEDIVLVTMSEFGRTAEENGNGGTDHGHGSMMMVLGGPVQGERSTASGRVLKRSSSLKAATWPSPPISAPCSANWCADTWARAI